MLTAHANTPIDEFIAQLRTYVIAMGLSTQVIDCVDSLAGIDDIESERGAALQQAADDAAVLTKNEILEAIRKWAATSLDEETMEQLISVIKDV